MRSRSAIPGFHCPFNNLITPLYEALERPTISDRERSGDRIGVLNRIFSVAYHVRLVDKRIKSRSKRAHYALKWLIIGGLLYWILGLAR